MAEAEAPFSFERPAMIGTDEELYRQQEDQEVEEVEWGRAASEARMKGGLIWRGVPAVPEVRLERYWVRSGVGTNLVQSSEGIIAV